MNTFSSTTLKNDSSRWSFWLVSLALVAGLILSILSWLELCVEHCSANQEYNLFGIPFAFVGISFFTGLIALHFLSRRYSSLSQLVGWLIGSALGAELMFIAIQKNQIGHWCPLCLSIAAAVGFAALVLMTGYFKNFKVSLQHHNRGDIMHKIKQALASISFVVLGFLVAFIGVGKADSAEAAMGDIKDRLAFGTKNSPIEVYFVTDWFCPSCRKVEPEIEKLYPKIQSRVTFYFIDYPIHKKSLNFTPYNLAFMVNSKSQYFRARDLLTELSEKTESPKDEDVIKAAKKSGIPYKDLTFLEVKTGTEYFDKIVELYDLRATPTIIVTNPRTRKAIKFEGRDEISEEKILAAIDQLSENKDKDE